MARGRNPKDCRLRVKRGRCGGLGEAHLPHGEPSRRLEALRVRRGFQTRRGGSTRHPPPRARAWSEREISNESAELRNATTTSAA